MPIDAEKRDGWDDHWTELNDITEVNPAQHYRHRLLAKILRNCLANRPGSKKIFDFGSGQGDMVAMLKQGEPNCEFLGLELSQVGVDISSRKNLGASFYKCNLLDDDDQRTELFRQADIGFCSEVLEHIDTPLMALNNIRKYLAPGALIVITVPGGPMNEFEKSIGHRKHYSKDELQSLVAMSGLNVVKTIRAGFPFFNLYKVIALMRGKKLLNDANQKGDSSFLMLFVLKVFDRLFKFNIESSPFGWQLLLIAENPR